MFWRFPIAKRHGGRLSRTFGVSHSVLLTDEEEVSKPVACFCIQRCGLESAAVVGVRLEATTAPAWADGVSTHSGLFDALLDARKDIVGEDGRIVGLVEDCADNGAGEVACERMLEEDLDLGD
jgi:hypothetical protein